MRAARAAARLSTQFTANMPFDPISLRPVYFRYGKGMTKPIRTAVFPVAGRGTRFLPATKASPKEMLPVVDKPLIQYAVEEAREAGAENFVFITGRYKRAIEDHFDVDRELERELESQQKLELLELLRDTVPAGANFIFIRQPAPLGLGHAVLCARPVVQNEPFFVHLADDLIVAEHACLSQMREVYETNAASVLATEVVPPDQTQSYGIVDIGGAEKNPAPIRAIVEKPSPATAPSNQAVVGRYILTPTIFSLLERTQSGAGGEIQLTDAIAALLDHEAVYSYAFAGRRFDCGNKLGYLQATVELALAHPELGDNFAEYLRTLGQN
jgi:UTP--glucose-1-phosphate uridylyltransferase